MPSVAKLLNEHPITTIFILCAGCVSATAGILLYFFQKNIDIVRDNCEGEKISCSARVQELTNKFANLRNSVAIDLQGEYYDATKSFIDADSVVLLSSQGYREVISNLVFVREPKDRSWQYEVISKEEHIGMYHDESCGASNLSNGESVSSTDVSAVSVWHKKESHSVPLKKLSTESLLRIDDNRQFDATIVNCEEFKIFPAISLYLVDAQWMDNSDPLCPRVSAVGEDSQSNPRRVCITAFGGELQSSMGKDNFRLAEATAYLFLKTFVNTLSITSEFSEYSPRIMSLQMGSNALYFKNRFRVQVKHKETLRDIDSEITVDDQYFVFDLGSKGLVVNITLPVLQDHSQNRAWTQQWLGELRLHREL